MLVDKDTRAVDDLICAIRIHLCLNLLLLEKVKPRNPYFTRTCFYNEHLSNESQWM